MANSEDEVVVRLRLKDVRQFIADVKAGKLAIDDLEKKVSKAGRTAARESSSSGGFGLFASLTKHLAFAIPMAIGGAAVATASYAVKSASDLEMVGVSFETLLHSASRAKTMISDLQDFAERTPFRLPDVEEGAQALLGYGFAARDIIPDLTAVGDAAAGLNLGAGGMNGVITALGQILSKGRVQGDEILQLNERHIMAQKYLMQGLHMGPQELRKAIEANKISAQKAIPLILKGLEKDFGGLMDKQAKTLGGLWSNFLDKAQRALVSGVNPMLPSIKKWVKGATDAIPTIMGTFSRLGDMPPLPAQQRSRWRGRLRRIQHHCPRPGRQRRHDRPADRETHRDYTEPRHDRHRRCGPGLPRCG
jgi:tape measure domain-containing protein